jgi:hypothetical protein
MSAPTTARDALSALCLSYLKPPRHGGSWTLNPDALADAIIAAGWRAPTKPCDSCTCDHPETWYELACKCCNRGGAA